MIFYFKRFRVQANTPEKLIKKDGAKTEKRFEDSDDSFPLKNSSSTKTEPTSPIGQSQPSINKTKIVLDSEPRKMVAELPVLLQDLSHSRLLMKYKQENKEATDLKPSGVYGAEPSDDGGIYGADPANIVSDIPTKCVSDNADEIEKMYLISACCDKKEDTNEVKKEEVSSLAEGEASSPKKTCIKSIIKQTGSEHVKSELEITNDPTVTFSTPPVQVNNTTPRKPAFNPLHVILKDKNKYHTTEYI